MPLRVRGSIQRETALGDICKIRAVGLTPPNLAITVRAGSSFFFCDIGILCSVASLCRTLYDAFGKCQQVQAMQTTKANAKWFRDRLAERAISVRKLAKLLDLDPSAASLTLRGMRKMTLKEANHIATLLGVSVTEVIRQAGIAVAEDVQGVKLLGTVDAKSMVQKLKDSAVKLVSAPSDVPHDGFVLQVRAAQSREDGWLLIVGAAVGEPDVMVDRLCVVTLKDSKRVVGVLRRGYEPETFNVVPYIDHQAVMEDQAVEAASPVLWIRPQ